MATREMNPTTYDILAGITAMDFSMVKLKLMDGEEGEGWSADQCERVEQEYRRYLWHYVGDILTRRLCRRKLWTPSGISTY